jgi:AraC-like DNA-binding protein
MASEVTFFSSVEQLESAAQTTGWEIEYRQLQRGNFNSWFTSYEIDGIYLAMEEFDNRLQVCCEPPQGFFGIMLPRFKPGRATVLGQQMKDGDLIVFPRDSEIEILTLGQMQNLTLFLAEDDFLATARALVPGKQLFNPGSASIKSLDGQQTSALRHNIDAMFQVGHPDIETVSNLLASAIQYLADASPGDGDPPPGRHAVPGIARRARDYIEAHYRETIRMQDLCTCTGIGLRTLQRCFATYYQISPREYIKARRLNAVRRELILSEPSHGHVTDIALRNGLAHLGRFSGEYRAFFGESPSETLRSASGLPGSAMVRPPVQVAQA